MTFGEFAAACAGFEDFHAAKTDDGPGAPSDEDFYAAVGASVH